MERNDASSMNPISPIKESFPQLTISAAAINSEPVELDSTPTSVEQVRLARRGSRALALDALQAEKLAREAEVQRREQLISERQHDPAVLVDIPQIPQAEELQQSGATES